MSRAGLIASAVAIIAVSSTGVVWAKYDDWFVLPKARKFVADKMRDPAATQFRNDRVTSNGWHCGEVNATNGMGGYVGFKRFASGGANGVIYLEGQGMLGEESTEELIAVLQKATERAEAFNKMRDSGAKVERPSKEVQFERARKDVFEDHWKAICES